MSIRIEHPVPHPSVSLMDTVHPVFGATASITVSVREWFEKNVNIGGVAFITGSCFSQL